MRTAEALERVGLAGRGSDRAHDLSGGEQQRVALARLLVKQPDVILADEPTTLLDLRNREMLRIAFERLEQQILCCTHDLELAASFDRALAVEGGQIVDDGEPAAVIARYRSRMVGQLQ